MASMSFWRSNWSLWVSKDIALPANTKRNDTVIVKSNGCLDEMLPTADFTIHYVMSFGLV